MQLLQILTQTVIFIHFYFNHFSHCVLISHCIFTLKIFKSIDTWYYFIYLDFVLLSRAAITNLHKLDQINTEIYFLNVQEAINLGPRCVQGWFLLRAVRKNQFYAFP